jgi:hypothetical protein
MSELDYMIEATIDECERASRFISNQTPQTLRDWAKRIESNFAPNAVCLPSMGLDRVAHDLREYLADKEKGVL